MSYETELFIRDREEWYLGLNDLNKSFHAFEEAEQDEQRRKIGSNIERSLLIPARQVIDMSQHIEVCLKRLDELSDEIDTLQDQEDDKPKKKVKTR